MFPVFGAASYARTHHDYPASDIIAACGLPVVAVTSGVILEVARLDMWDPQTDRGDQRGGVSISMLGDDGVRYYHAHLSTISPDIVPGLRVDAGHSLGQVGRTGKASACHLHFGISAECGRVGDWWIRRGVIWPWSYLDAWRESRPSSPAAQVSAWRTENGCPSAPPPNAL